MALNKVNFACTKKMNAKKLIEKFYTRNSGNHFQEESNESDLNESDERFLNVSFHEPHISPVDFTAMDD